MASASQPQKLSAIQLHLLRFFSERNVSDQETVEIQRLIAQYYANKADELMDDIWVERGFTEQTMEDILNAPIQKSNSVDE